MLDQEISTKNGSNTIGSNIAQKKIQYSVSAVDFSASMTRHLRDQLIKLSQQKDFLVGIE